MEAKAPAPQKIRTGSVPNAELICAQYDIMIRASLEILRLAPWISRNQFNEQISAWRYLQALLRAPPVVEVRQ